MDGNPLLSVILRTIAESKCMHSESRGSDARELRVLEFRGFEVLTGITKPKLEAMNRVASGSGFRFGEFKAKPQALNFRP